MGSRRTRRIAEGTLFAVLGAFAGQSEDHLVQLVLWAAAALAGLVLVADFAIPRVRVWKRRRSAAGLPWRDDRRELADAFDKMASQVRVYLDDRSNARPAIEATNVAAMMEAHPERVESEVKLEAADYSATVTRANVMLQLGDAYEQLFDQAVLHGVVAPSAKKRFTQPVDIEQLPAMSREVAKRLRQPPKGDQP